MPLVQKPYTFANDTMLADADQVNENFDVLYDLVNGKLDDANLGLRTISDDVAPVGNTGTMTALMNGLANRVKAIMGEPNWRENPKTSLAAIAQSLQAIQNTLQTLTAFTVSMKGVIVMWSGSADNIPEGWALCDGTNGTPDLRDRFIVGAGREYAVGATGGAKEVTLTTAQMPKHSHTGSTNSAGAHTHTGTTNTAGAHTHSYTRYSRTERVSQITLTANALIGTSTVNTSSAGAHSHTLNINSAGAHTHTVTTNEVGGGQPHENRPPYYALCYIMRVA